MHAGFQRGNLNAGEQLKDLCVRRYRFRDVDKPSAYLAARRPLGSGRPSDIKNTKICCEFFGILFRSSDRRTLYDKWQSLR